MAVETLYATSLSSGTVSGSANALGAPNGTYTTDSGATSWTARFAMGNPTNPIANGTHTVTLRVRKVGTANPTVDYVSLYAGPTLLATNTLSTAVTSTVSQDVSTTFAASLLSGRDLSTIEYEIGTTGAGGSPSARGPVQLDAVTWSGDFTAAPNAGTSTGGYDFTGTTAGSANHNATSTGAYDFSSIAVTGSRASQGSLVGAFDFAGIVVGEVPPNLGSTSGAYDFTGTATGDTPPNVGGATGAYDFTGSAVGQARQVSDWSDSASATTAAGGPNSGIVTGGYAFTGVSRTGSRMSLGSLTGVYDFTGVPVGETPANGGLTSGQVDWAGSATGFQPPGQGAGAPGGVAWAGTAGGVSPVLASRSGAASGSFVFTLLVSSSVEHRGQGLGWLTYTGVVDGLGVDPTYTFEPPVYQRALEPAPLTRRPRISLTEALSVVRVNGNFVQIKSPDSAQLTGVEGEDYFIGGHVYRAVPQAVGLELQAAGYNVTEN